jgi:preprotein translocase subunit SecF
MRWKPFRPVPDGTNYPFVQWSRYGYILSGVLCALSILLFAFKGLNYGIDFKGGTVLNARTQGVAQIEEIRSKLNGLDLGDVEVQEFGGPSDVLIRLEAQSGGEEAETQAQLKVREALGSEVQILGTETVGAKVSGELTEQAILAVLISIVGVLIYLWFRFEWQYAVGAVISLLHDVLLSIGLFSLIGLEFNLNIIAAILTIIGYSLNDTVVNFDRVREFMRKYKSMNIADLLDFSINSVLPRTLLTSVCTLIALLSLYIFGGEVIRGFAFAMIWGVFVGTYSSVFVAVPILMIYGLSRDRKVKTAAEAAAARP